MKKTILLLFFLYSISVSNAQSQPATENYNTITPCATAVPDEKWEQLFSQYIQNYKASAASNKTQNQVITIPVIVHVIHGGQALGTYPNISAAQIQSQIKVLNDDFGGLGYNKGNYPASAFSTWAQNQNVDSSSLDVLGRIKIANCEVQFCLATKDTLGNPLAEPGIERLNYISKGWSNPASFGSSINNFTSYMNNTVKPQSIWNVSKYFNIWISDISSSSGLLGYATFPPFTSNLSGIPGGYFGTAQSDGVWCWARAFGSASTFPGGTYANGYNRGRTATHEVGHWLGLRHIWGDGNCLSDYCSDTPSAAGQNFGSPNYPYKTTNCSGNSPNGEMFMNFMDYTNDPAKYMFTEDQALRVKTAMQTSPYRNQLGTHNLCSLQESAAVSNFQMVNTVCENQVVTLFNNSSGSPVPNYTWSTTGGAIILPNANNNLVTIQFTVAGTHTVSLAADNGTLSVQQKTITVNPAPQLNFIGYNPMVCSGDQVLIVAGGADSYTWEPGPINGNSYGYIATSLGTHTLQCSGLSPENCFGTSTLNVQVVECVGLSENAASSLSFELFPNPVSDYMDILIQNGQGSTYQISIEDLSGKVVQREELDCPKGSCKQSIQLNMEKGVYMLSVVSENGLRLCKRLVKL